MKRVILISMAISLLFILTAGPALAQHFAPVSITGANYAITITTAQVNAIIPLEAGVDEIGLFAMDGVTEICVGAGLYTGVPLGLVAYEDDTFNTPLIKDGFVTGEAIIIRVWDASEGVEYVAQATYSTGDGTYGLGLFSIISMLTTSAPIPTVSEWGLMAMSLLLLIAGTLVMRRQRILTVGKARLN
ncbi:MAG: IPTL-CTERM sorting domain-containing protein [Planctomycetes bacterium]|nr:IPTL-CTERM sorting domain-containing protein [Planctomycetota bacterium]